MRVPDGRASPIPLKPCISRSVPKYVPNLYQNHKSISTMSSAATIPIPLQQSQMPATSDMASPLPSPTKTKMFEKNVKLLLIGDSGVGKTCMMMRFTESMFEPTFITTIGIDYKYKVVNIDGKPIKLEIWDSAGQERFRSITSSYLRGAHGILLCYSVIDRHSFDHVVDWMKQIHEISDAHVNILLVGNKCDRELERHVTTEEGNNLALKYGMEFMEVSAKTGLNVEPCFTRLAKSVLDRMEGQGIDSYAQKGGRKGGSIQVGRSDAKLSGTNLACCP